MYKDLILEKTKRIIDVYFYICDSIKTEGFENADKAIDIDENYKLIRTNSRWYIKSRDSWAVDKRVQHHDSKGRNDEIGELIKKFLELYI